MIYNGQYIYKPPQWAITWSYQKKANTISIIRAPHTHVAVLASVASHC